MGSEIRKYPILAPNNILINLHIFIVFDSEIPGEIPGDSRLIPVQIPGDSRPDSR